MNKWRNPDWKYSDANETSQPGYLRRKFKQLERQQKEAEEAQAQKVTALPERKRGGK